VRKRLLVIFIVCFLVSAGDLSAQVLAFPEADGFGRYASGGRGGKVLEVTNLNDSGAGSLRAAIEEKGPRTIVFRTSGTIPLESDLLIENGDLTIAGQTAPGDGICIKDFGTIIAANNVIIRFLRFRLGDERGQASDALTAMGGRNVIIDHCSMSWGIDEVGSFYDNQDFTLQWCIISESLDNSIHPKGRHGYAGIWGGTRASFHHNLLAHHSSRNPRFQGGRIPERGETEQVDYRNNVVYNWGFKPAYGGENGRQNMVANYYKPGPATLRKDRFLEPDDAEGKWYVSDNVLEGSATVSADNWNGGVAGPFRESGRVTKPFEFVARHTQRAEEAYEDVLRFGGALLPKRDAVDKRIVDEVRRGTATFGNPSYAREHKLANGPYGIIDSQSEVGGWPLLKSEIPPMDADNDGIPDAWEIEHGLNPSDPKDGRMIGASGYSNLEIYLNEIIEKRLNPQKRE